MTAFLLLLALAFGYASGRANSYTWFSLAPIGLVKRTLWHALVGLLWIAPLFLFVSSVSAKRGFKNASALIALAFLGLGLYRFSPVPFGAGIPFTIPFIATFVLYPSMMILGLYLSLRVSQQLGEVRKIAYGICFLAAFFFVAQLSSAVFILAAYPTYVKDWGFFLWANLLTPITEELTGLGLALPLLLLLRKFTVKVDQSKQPTPLTVLQQPPSNRQNSYDTQNTARSESSLRQFLLKNVGTTTVIAALGGLFGLLGLGHIYVGKVGNGLGILFGGLLVLGAALVTLLQAQSAIGESYLHLVLFNPAKAHIALETARGYLLAGVISFLIYCCGWLWQIFDARIAARQYNQQVLANGKDQLAPNSQPKPASFLTTTSESFKSEMPTTRSPQTSEYPEHYVERQKCDSLMSEHNKLKQDLTKTQAELVAIRTEMESLKRGQVEIGKYESLLAEYNKLKEDHGNLKTELAAVKADIEASKKAEPPYQRSGLETTALRSSEIMCKICGFRSRGGDKFCGGCGRKIG